MKKTIPYWQVAGFLFTAVVGTLLHFLFDWTGGNVAAALFSAVNESIWEHLKLLFYPMVIVALVEYFFWGKDVDGFWCVKLTGILLGIFLIPVLYYTYTGILGVNADWFNITIFFFVAGIVFWVETKLFQSSFFLSVGFKSGSHSDLPDRRCFYGPYLPASPDTSFSGSSHRHLRISKVTKGSLGAFLQESGLADRNSLTMEVRR